MTTKSFLHPVKKHLINSFGDSFIYTNKTNLKDYLKKIVLSISLIFMMPSLFSFSLPINIIIGSGLLAVSLLITKYCNLKYFLQLFNTSSFFTKLTLIFNKPLYYKLKNRAYISQFGVRNIIESMEDVASQNILKNKEAEEFTIILEKLKTLYIKEEFNQITFYLDKLERFINMQEEALIDSLIHDLEVFSYDSTYGKKTDTEQKLKDTIFTLEKGINA